MKKLIILIIFAVFALSSHAQGNIEVGLKAGLNTSKISLNLNELGLGGIYIRTL